MLYRMDLVTFMDPIFTHSGDPPLISPTVRDWLEEECLETQQATMDLGGMEDERDE